jgi:hypothetical protein
MTKVRHFQGNSVHAVFKKPRKSGTPLNNSIKQ